MARILALAGLVAALAALAVAPGADAATGLSTNYTLAGIETSIPTNNTSTFAGTALGSSFDLATWRASVVHEPLSSCPFGSGTSCAITAGTFALKSTTGSQLSGSFTGGSVTPVSQAAGCGRQVFAVSGALATTAGPGSFSATLTHYRTLLFGRCIPYFATVSGTLHVS
jgi:hypothetical protein